MKVVDLLTDESKWCQGELAKNSMGEDTIPLANDACRWCLTGAIVKCYEDRLDRANAFMKVSKILRELYPQFFSVPAFNDLSKFADVRRVIELAQV